MQQSGAPETVGTSRSARLMPVLAFTAMYLTVALVAALVRGNQEFFFYIGVMVVLIACVWPVHRSVGFTSGLLWCLSCWGLAHMAGGLVPVPADWPVNEGGRVLYSLWLIPDRLKYDHVIHAYGFGITTWACWQGLCGAFRRRGVIVTPGVGLITLSVAAGLGFGALNEVVEFFATLLVPETNVGGYVNTGWDLVANTVGALIAGAIIAWRGATHAEIERAQDAVADLRRDAP